LKVALGEQAKPSQSKVAAKEETCDPTAAAHIVSLTRAWQGAYTSHPIHFLCHPLVDVNELLQLLQPLLAALDNRANVTELGRFEEGACPATTRMNTCAPNSDGIVLPPWVHTQTHRHMLRSRTGKGTRTHLQTKGWRKKGKVEEMNGKNMNPSPLLL
jgi:hypothetical protein